MTKDLFDLSTREFIYVLLGYSPKLQYTIHWKWGENTSEQVYEGTYQEIYNELPVDHGIRESFYNNVFDYNKSIGFTETIEYLSRRTDHFMPELTQALLIDINDEEIMVFKHIEADYQDKSDFERWKDSSTSAYYRAKSFLSSKCTEFRRKKLLSSFANGGETEPGVSELTSDNLQSVSESETPPVSDHSVSLSDKADHSIRFDSDRLNRFYDKVGQLFINGCWHNNDRMEYAIFLKVLYCIVYRKGWDKNVSWEKVTRYPLQDGTNLNPKQLAQKMKLYNDADHEGIRKHFEELLNEE